ncbi:hypothetical protein MA16_Dca021007 [Dendrobium catenatum]|uniref:Uncharacterized protein n=1 Tax=Dendrobium catenatum TaxID=906689 RepID=A0A2I0VZJ7_9ASPA|nr:hypothetical protein MA16_Dca021007 [Dendrobium catenatum]
MTKAENPDQESPLATPDRRRNTGIQRDSKIAFRITFLYHSDLPKHLPDTFTLQFKSIKIAKIISAKIVEMPRSPRHRKCSTKTEFKSVAFAKIG